MIQKRRLAVFLCIGLIGVSLFFMTKVIGRFPFHEDEAFYTSYSKDILQGDLFLTAKGLDKPPVFMYIQAAFMHVLGESPITARLPNVLAFLLTNLILCSMIRRVFDLETAFFVLLFLSTSPLLLLFGPTAFVDGIAALWGLLSLERLSQKKWFAAGSCAVLAAFTKQYFGLFIFYNIAAMLLIPSLKQTPETFKSWLRGIFYTALPFIFWETFCNRPPWFMLTNAKTAYQKWAHPVTLPESFLAWTRFYHLVLGSNVINAAVIIGLAVFLLMLFFKTAKARPSVEQEKKRWELFFTFWLLSYFLLIASQPRIPHWERYLLPGAYPLCIMAGWIFSRFSNALRLPNSLRLLLFAGLFVFMVRFDISHVLQLDPAYNVGANFSRNNGLAEMFKAFDSLPKDSRAVVLLDGSGFLTRYYAYHKAYPADGISRETLNEELEDYMFCPIFFIAQEGALSMASLPQDLGPLWTGRSLAAAGNFRLWTLIPDDKYRIANTPKNIAAAFSAMTGHPAQAVQQKSCTAIELTGHVRDGIPATLHSCWTSVSVFKEAGHYAIEGVPQKTEVLISVAAASQTLQQKNPNIQHLQTEMTQTNELKLTGALLAASHSIPFSITISPHLENDSKVSLAHIKIMVWNYSLPKFICNLLQKLIPTQNLRLPHWVGVANNIYLDFLNNEIHILSR